MYQYIIFTTKNDDAAVKYLPLFFLGNISEKFVTEIGDVRPKKNPNALLQNINVIQLTENALKTADKNCPKVPIIMGFLLPILSETYPTYNAKLKLFKFLTKKFDS